MLRSDSKTSNIERVPLVVTYNPALGCLNKIIKDYQPVLHTSQRCKEVFREPTLFSFRKGRNLSDLLTSKRLPVDPHHLAQRHDYIALPVQTQSAHAQFVAPAFKPTGIWRFTSNAHTRQSHLTAKINPGSVPAKPTGGARHANIMGSLHIPSRAQTPAKAS